MDELKSGMDELNLLQNEMDGLVNRILDLELQSCDANNQLIGLKWRYQKVAQQLNEAHLQILRQKGQ
jgi:hypothetical protein